MKEKEQKRRDKKNVDTNKQAMTTPTALSYKKTCPLLLAAFTGSRFAP